MGFVYDVLLVILIVYDFLSWIVGGILFCHDSLESVLAHLLLDYVSLIALDLFFLY